MVKAVEVRPDKWENIVVLFDNGTYSSVAGEYEGDHALGERWSASPSPVGFPSLGKNPLWHVVPNFLSIPFLHGLLQQLCRSPYDGSEQHLDAVVNEIKRFSSSG